jgi:sugar phosphate isomerase/epimerase
MSNMRVAAQLYTLREFLRTPDEIARSLHKVAEIGYKAVQLSAMGPIEPARLKEIADREGLTICSTHVDYDELLNETQRMIAEHKLWGCRHVAIGSMPARYRQAGEQGFRQFAREASELGRRLHEAGLTFSYHNHSFEFERFGNKLGLEIIFEESDPRYLLAEIDTYWVQHGGGDPVQWIRRYAGRMVIVHFKDMGVRNGQQTMAEVGEGNLNWPAIVAACREAGIEWCAVEQDICHCDPFESLAISLRNLKGLGLE